MYLKNLRAAKRPPESAVWLNKTGAETSHPAAVASVPVSSRSHSKGRDHSHDCDRPKPEKKARERAVSRPATKISDYTIGAQIGQGAYATVKQAVEKSTGRKVAVKVYEKSRLLDPQRKLSVNREIHLLKKLAHAHIVKLFDVIETSRQLFLVMEYVRGKSLYTYLHTKLGKRLDEAEAFMIFRQILEGIDHCHKNNVSHRDIKLENILMGPDGTVKIIDFGFSVCAASTQKLKIFCGTPSYMAPEIVNRKEYLGPPSDMWSLGILLYMMICGCAPFRGNCDRELFRNISRGQMSFPAHVSAGARAVITQMLRVDPAKRVASAEVCALGVRNG